MTWSRRRRTFEPEIVADMRRRYEAGASTRDIAKTVGCSGQTVSRILGEAGVTLDRGAKIAIKARGRPSGVKGKRWSAESRQRLSNAKKGKPGHIGYRFTNDQRLRMSVAQKLIQMRNPTRMDTARAAIRKRDPVEVAANKAVRIICKNSLRRVLVMARRRKDRRLEELLGYTKVELRAHLESQFESGMSWTDRRSFHVDHIVPVASFARHSITDPRVVNSLINLRPLGRFDNQSKNDTHDDRLFNSHLLAILKSTSR